MAKEHKKINDIRGVIARPMHFTNILLILDEVSHGNVFFAIESERNKFICRMIDGVEVQFYTDTTKRNYVSKLNIRAYDHQNTKEKVLIYKGHMYIRDTDQLTDILSKLSHYSRVLLGDAGFYDASYYYKGDHPMY